jgi:phospholipase C
VVSPWAKHGFVDHTMYEFGSLLKLAEVNFNLPTLGTRDVNANDMMNSFNFNQSPQSALVEHTNFVGPAAVASTSVPRNTQTSASTASYTAESIAGTGQMYLQDQVFLIVIIVVSAAAILAVTVHNSRRRQSSRNESAS